MLYYFSGTGNSRYVSNETARYLKEESCPITSPHPTEDTSIGIVFPIYAWGMPRIVKHFIEEKLRHLITINSSPYIYVIMTCGDDIGYADKLTTKSLNLCHLPLAAAFSIQMPNTYVALPGFDVDDDSLTKEKLSKAHIAIPIIASNIRKRAKMTLVTRGKMPWIKTHILRPLFTKLLMNDKKFHSDKNCTHCKKCHTACPVNNITLENHTDGKPSWMHHCEGCLACYHVCPRHAIHYGRFTKGKGQKKLL